MKKILFMLVVSLILSGCSFEMKEVDSEEEKTHSFKIINNKDDENESEESEE